MQILYDFMLKKSEIELPQEFWEKQNSSAPYRAIYSQTTSLLFLMIYILYVNFCAILSTINRDQRTPKILEKVKLQRHLLSDFC